MYHDIPDEDDEFASLTYRVRARARAHAPRHRPHERVEDAPLTSTHPGITYRGKKHEMAWLETYLRPFLDDHQITDVLRQIKGGKEATVYCCRAPGEMGHELVAAKVYRPRMFRNLRNDAQYRAGRGMLDEYGKGVHDFRRLHAVRKGTAFGQELAHTSWLSHEFATLRLLHEAGIDVPEPYLQSDNAILMEHIGDSSVSAPTLHGVDLSPHEARRIFARLIDDVEGMLANGRIHADLSAYNVLYWHGDVTIIDLPQSVDPLENPDAFALFQRDIQRLCDHFRRYGIGEDGDALASAIWHRHIGEETVAMEAILFDLAAQEQEPDNE